MATNIITIPGQDGHGTRPKRPGSGVGPGDGVVEDRVRRECAGRFGGSPIGKNVGLSVRTGPFPTAKYMNKRTSKGKFRCSSKKACAEATMRVSASKASWPRAMRTINCVASQTLD